MACFAAGYQVFTRRWRKKWRAGLAAGRGRRRHGASTKFRLEYATNGLPRSQP